MTATVELAREATPDTGKRTVSRREFARLLGIGTATLDRHRDGLPRPLAVRFRRVLWNRDDVMKFIAGRRERET